MSVPSPAPRGQLPWMTAIYETSRKQAELLDECKADRLRLITLVGKLRARLVEARERQELWELRRQAWTRERAFLLSQLDGKPVPSP